MNETVVILPELEGLVAIFLQNDPTISAELDGRVYTSVPADKVWPLARVVLVDDVKVTQRPLWLVTASMQIDVWGGSNWDATRIARTMQGVLAARLVGVHDRGVVTGVSFGAMRNAPDPEFTPAKPRRIFTVNVTAHP